MIMHRLAITALLLSLGGTIAVRAQQSEAERQALARIKESAEKGDPHAQLELGMIYGSGARAYRDVVKAAKWHRKAADQGYAPAQYQVGLDYAHGDGVKVNQVEAAKWFRSAAEHGLVEAQYEIASCYLNGRGVPESGTAAVEWFRKAADQGSTDAEFQLGNCYFQGTGVPKNIEEGIKWVRSAAEKGLPAAQARLGTCYQKGEAVAKDYVQAYKWFALAGAQDDEHAADIKVSLATLESNLTKEQVLEAQRLASDFHPGKKSDQSGSAPVPTTSGSEIAKAGYVNVMTEEARSEVYVDGAFVGNPPSKLKLPEGLHVVEVKKSGFKDYRRELRVMSGSDLTLKVEMEKR